MPSAKDVAVLGAAILGVVPGGQAFAPIAAGLAKLLPGGDDSKKEKTAAWAVKRIPEWKSFCRGMFALNFPDATKADKLQRAIRADWFEAFGEEPKRRWVEQLAENVYDAVLDDMSTEAIEKAAENANNE